MRIEIEIPKEFEEHFRHDKFEDTLLRLSYDAHLIAGNYEQETAIMLIKAFKESKTAYDVDKVVDACAEVASKIPGLCGIHCPIDCHYFTEQSCKESWKLYLEEHLKEGEKYAGNI